MNQELTPATSPAASAIVRMILKRQDRITILGNRYTLPEPTAEGYILRRVEALDIAEAFSHVELSRLSGRTDWSYEEDFFDPKRLKGHVAHRATSMDDLARKEQAIVLWRWEYCTRFERMLRHGLVDASDEGMAAAIDIIDEDVSKLPCAVKQPVARKKASKPKPRKTSNASRAGTPRVIIVRQKPSVSTLRRWRRRLKEYGHQPWNLRDLYANCGRDRPQIVGEAYRLLVEYAEKYASPTKPTYAQLHKDLKAAVEKFNEQLAPENWITCPSKKSLRAYVLGMSAFYVYAQREGIEKAKAHFAVITAGPEVLRPFERIELDHWTVNLRSLLTRMGYWDQLTPHLQSEIGRMYFCGAIDAASKCVVGARLSVSPTTEDALAVCEMAVSCKNGLALAAGAATPWDMYAGLEGVGMDGGSPFANEPVRRAITALGGLPDYPPGGVPQLRPFIERFFRSVDVGLIARLAGRTFENILARGDINPDDTASITADDLSWAIVRWIVDAYHNSEHDGLAGETPRNAWIRLTGLYRLKPAPDRHVRRHVFGISLDRKLGNNGIRVLGLHYWSDCLARYFIDHGHVDLEVKLDPKDLGRISARFDGQWHTLTCTRPGMDDISVDTWVQFNEDLRRIHADQAKLTEHVVLEALRAIEMRNREAMARAGIALMKATTGQIDQAEREILQAYALPRPASPQGGSEHVDPLAGGFPVGVDDRPDSAPTKTEPSSFSIEE